MASPTPNPDTGIMRSTRDIHPQHYSIRIKRFSLLAERQEKYESYPFEAGGYKWRLLLYPKGNAKCFDWKGHISLYLAIQDTDSFPKQWEVYVDFKVLVFDHVHNNYLVFQDLGVKRYHELKTVFGFNKLLSVEAFNDVRNGYLDDDSCIFGAEVFVIKQPTVYESIVVKDPSKGALEWNIPIWDIPISKEFTVEKYKWRLRVELEAYGPENKKYLSIYLDIIDAAKLGSEEQIFADFKLRLLNERKRGYFYADNELNTYGWRKVMQLEDAINYRSNWGYVQNNSIVVGVEIMFISMSKVVRDSACPSRPTEVPRYLTPPPADCNPQATWGDTPEAQ